MGGAMIYILATIFIALVGYLFFSVFRLASEMQNLTVESMVMRPVFGNINSLFIFIVPLIAMKLFSEEKKQGTMNLLLTSPLSNTQIIFSKVLTGLALILFLLALTLIFPITLVSYGYQNMGALFTSYLGATLNALCYLVLSCFVSSLTKNSILAALLGIFGILFFVILAWTAQTTKNFLIAQIFEYVSLPSHFEAFSRGTVRSYDLVYYMSFIFSFFLLTSKSIAARNW